MLKACQVERQSASSAPHAIPVRVMSAYFSFPSSLRFLDSTSKLRNGLKVPLTAPTIANSSSIIISPRNGFVLPSLRFSVSPRVGFLQLHRRKSMLTTITIRMKFSMSYKRSEHVSGGYFPVQFSVAFLSSSAGAVDCGRVTTRS
jgi:hypothetical protein